MDICKKEEKPSAIAGHLYELKSSFIGQVYMYTSSGKMVRLNDGVDSINFTDVRFWKDVTDKYCLKEI